MISVYHVVQSAKSNDSRYHYPNKLVKAAYKHYNYSFSRITLAFILLALLFTCWFVSMAPSNVLMPVAFLTVIVGAIEGVFIFQDDKMEYVDVLLEYERMCSYLGTNTEEFSVLSGSDRWQYIRTSLSMLGRELRNTEKAAESNSKLRHEEVRARKWFVSAYNHCISLEMMQDVGYGMFIPE